MFQVNVQMQDGSQRDMVVRMSRDRVDQWARRWADRGAKSVWVKHPSGVSQQFWFANKAAWQASFGSPA